MKDYVPLNNPYKEAFHFRGAFLSIVVAVAIIFVMSAECYYRCAMLIPAFFCIYKILFDGIIGIEVYGDFFYLGTTAKQDRWLNTHFPHDMAGEVKVFLAVIVLLFVNVLNYLI